MQTLTRPELAEALGLHIQTLHNWAAIKNGPRYFLSNSDGPIRAYYSVDQVDAWALGLAVKDPWRVRWFNRKARQLR